jgi:septum formation protein
MRIILASQSEFRKKALEILGLKYEVKPSNIDEKSIRDSNPVELARKLAEAKALEVAKTEEDSIIIASDLFVTFNSKIYEKPISEEEAFEMLKSFSGNILDILTGVAVYNTKTGKLLSAVSASKLRFRNLTDFEIKDYIKRYPVLKCAAAFESDGASRFGETISGDYPAHYGIPLKQLILFLRENHIEV